MAGKTDKHKKVAFGPLDAYQTQFLETMGIDPAQAQKVVGALQFYEELQERVGKSAKRIHALIFKDNIQVGNEEAEKENNIPESEELTTQYLSNDVSVEFARLLDYFKPDKSALIGLGREVTHRVRVLNRGISKKPTAPPAGQTYENRPDRSENAPDFISRVYKDWLTGEFTRADLRKIDKSAERALNNWEQHSGTRAPINLPTLKEFNDARLATNPKADPSASHREFARISAQLRRRQKNPHKS